MTQILIAEDEPRIASFIEKGLRSHGFTTVVAPDATVALELALSGGFDLLLLDLGLPVKDGFTVLEELRGQGVQIPIIILTARDDIQDKIAGLEGGANDYVTKPFRFEELLARIRLRLRDRPQSSHQHEEMLLAIGSLSLNLRTRCARLKEAEIELSTKEFTFLETLMRHRGQVMSREQLLDHVWGYNYDPGSNIVDVYVGYLRKKIGSSFIETVRGMGYRLVG
jgi:two-component system, OmpR family, response regulator QseB